MCVSDVKSVSSCLIKVATSQRRFYLSDSRLDSIGPFDLMSNSRSTRVWVNNSRRSESEGKSSSSTVATVASSSYIRSVFDRMLEDKNRELSSSSPTSVVTVPLTPPSLQSRIVLDPLSEEQQGTEVTLLEEDAQILPRRCFADDVLDEAEEDQEDLTSVMTPLPSSPPPCTEGPTSQQSNALASPATPLRVPLCGMGKVCWKQSPVTPGKDNGHRSMLPVHDYILAFLGNKDTTGSWHKQFSGRVEEQDEGEMEARIQQQNLLRRHPDQCKAKKAHLHDLRRNLGFGQSPRRSNLCRSTSHQAVQSARKAPRTPRKDGSFDKQSSVKSSIWQAFACHQAVSESVIDETVVMEAGGYDSDPECFGRTPYIRSPPRQEVEPTSRRLFALDVMGDQESIVEIAKSILNEKWTLILHENHERPKAYHVWVERGQRLAKKVVAPKLSWKPVPKKGGRSGIRSVPAVSIDILDVQRILKLEEVDRQEYPLAKATDSLLLKTLNGSYCFQASSSIERDRLVDLWKLTVARFGSMLITCDDDGMEDYFAPFDAAVLPA